MRAERRSGERRLELPHGSTRWDALIMVLQDDRALCGAAFIMSVLACLTIALHLAGVIPGIERVPQIESTAHAAAATIQEATK